MSDRRTLELVLPALYLALVSAATFVGIVLVLRFGYELPLGDPGAFRFERPLAALLLLGPVLTFVAGAVVHRDRTPRVRTSRLATLAAAPRSLRTYLVALPVALRAVALTAFVLALMGPQSIHVEDEAEVEGIDIVLVLDVSLSMQATDIVPNRYVAMQQVVADFVARRPNDRIAAVVFGSEAYTLMPLTTDHEALANVLRELQLGVANGEGTAIGNALATGVNRLRRSEAASKVMILLTDGDSNAGNVSPDEAAQIAASMRIKTYTVLMGATADARVPVGRDMFGRPVYGQGSFGINPELLRSIAERTGGEAFAVSDRASLERSFHTILDRLARSRLAEPGRIYGELYPAFVLPALALLVLELLLATVVLRRWP